MTLGDENGIECTRKIRKQSPTTHVILLSVYPDRLSHQLGLQAGAEACVDKGDLNVTVLREIINDAMDATI
jgi:DNA-binding NarL/FixJ family response regulator